MNFHFSCKRTPTLFFGAGNHQLLPELLERFGRELLLVLGTTSFAGSDNWLKLRKRMESEGYVIHTEQIDGEPSPEVIDAICARYVDTAIEVVVAIGGGSVLDAGKAISAMLVEQQPVISYLEGVGTRSPSGNKVPFVAVPTTAGTGSEATSNAVLSRAGTDGFKKSLRHDNYVPDLAIIDPALAVSCPPALTAACGMDAFTQLVEAYLSTRSSPFTEALALDGIHLLVRSLVAACRNGADLQARGDLAYGSYLSGIALANAGLGAVHGVAGVLGGRFGLPHGVACASLMAPANRITLKHLQNGAGDQAMLARYQRLGEIASGTTVTGSEASDFFIDYLWQLRSTLAIDGLARYGVTQADFDTIIARAGSKNNPVAFSGADFADLLAASL